MAGLVTLANRGIIANQDSVAVISTGNGLKDTANALKAAGEPLRLPPDIKVLAEKLEEDER